MKHPFTRNGARGARKKQAKTDVAVRTKRIKKLSFSQIIFVLMVASLALIGASGYYWYQNVLTNPDRILSDALDKSMQTTSVYRTIEQKGDQNTVNQSLYLSFSPQTVARSVTNLEESSSAGKSSVETETIGTKDNDFVRYNSIDVSMPNTKTKQNFDNVLNVWGKRENNQETGQTTSFLNDALFVAVPFGNLNADQRKQLKNEIKSVNLYDTLNTQTEFINGRPIITYTVSISPKALVQVLAKYVDITGVGSAADLDPAQYEKAAKTQVSIDIDVLSRHVKKINFEQSGRVETYGAYNSKQDVTLPTQTIGVDELQTRLSKVEQTQKKQN